MYDSCKSMSIKRLEYILAEKGIQSEGDTRIPIVLRALEVSKSIEPSLVEICAVELLCSILVRIQAIARGWNPF
jgi:hypothetical protein